MSAVQYYLLEWESGHLVKLLERLKEASATAHVTVSLVEGEIIDLPRGRDLWRPSVRYAVRLTAEQIADLAVQGLYDFEGCRAVPQGSTRGGVLTKDKLFRSETPLLQPRHTDNPSSTLHR